MRITCILLPITLFFGLSTLFAGERLPLETLVVRSDVIVEVTVRLATGDAADRITEINPLTQWPQSIAPSADWFGACLPSKELIETRLIPRHPQFPSVSLWRKAIDDGGYQAVIFLRKKDGRLSPTCDAEAMLAENWSSHSEHHLWRKRLFHFIEQSDHLKPEVKF
jgi:hypothetical protein